MKRKIFNFTCALILALILPISILAANSTYKYAIDDAGLMSDAQVTTLENDLKALSDKYDFDIVALTVDSLDGKTPVDYADDYYDYNGYRDDGCLFLVSMEDRDFWISTKGYGETAITNYGIKVLEEEAVPYLSDGDYYKAFEVYSGIVEEFVTEARDGSPYDTNHLYSNSAGHTYDFGTSSYDDDDGDEHIGALIVAFIVAIIVASVIAGMVKKSYKPVRFNANARDYLVPGSLNVTRSYDHFLYSNVSKTEIQSESSSRGGGSSTHTSSSGSSHGGGGGKF